MVLLSIILSSPYKTASGFCAAFSNRAVKKNHLRHGSLYAISERWYFADYETNESSDTTKESSSTPSRKKIVFLGTPEVAATTLQTLYEASQKQQQQHSFEISAVVSQPPKRQGRKKKLVQSPVAQLALELDLPLLTPEKANKKDFLDHLQNDIQPDLCITAAYGQYLPKRFLAAPALGTVNIHPSLLPRWRGASPVQRSLEAGDNPVGVTVLYTVSAMDAGPIIAQQEYTCDEQTENASILLPLLFEKGTNMLLDNLPALFDQRMTMDTAQPQNDDHAVAAPLIHSSEAELKPWQESARDMHNRMRGFSMWPQTFMYMQVYEDADSDEPLLEKPFKVKVLETRYLEEPAEEHTTVVQLGPHKKKDGMRVVCHDKSVLELIRVIKVGNNKPFMAKDLQNGYPGKVLRWVESPEPEEGLLPPKPLPKTKTAATTES